MKKSSRDLAMPCLWSAQANYKTGTLEQSDLLDSIKIDQMQKLQTCFFISKKTLLHLVSINNVYHY
ncbi:MAG: hypothetical protein D3923_13325 [Candidatus Electrothrix sp. AR3]|nr:hypothetical protein [Candidatus Electrothrix sp. AR3]